MLLSGARRPAREQQAATRVTVSLYEKPPREELTLDEFEVFAVDRLRVLRTIDALRQKGFKPQELDAELKPLLSRWLPLAAAGPNADRDRRKDDVSHFILRLAYSRTEELRRWFLAQECRLFQHRLGQLQGSAFARFLDARGMAFEEVPADEADARAAALSKCGGGVVAGATTWYRVPFLEAIDLVGRREAYLEKGKAYVPQAKLHAIVVARFRSALSRSLARASSGLAAASADPRLAPLLGNVERHDLEKRTAEDDDVEGITPEQIDALADQSMPLCMQQLHGALKRDHKLKHWGRQQYGLFLKAAGLSLEDQLRFFQTEFTKIMTAEQFSKEYAYNIRHRYGKEGKRTEYSPYGCFKLIMDMAPGPGEYHGCPYKHFDADHLAAVLAGTTLEPSEQQAVLAKAKDRNYMIACQRHFEFTHPKSHGVTAKLDGVGSHPNAYFKSSRVYHQELAAAKDPEGAAKAKAQQQAAAAAAAGPAAEMVLAN